MLGGLAADQRSPRLATPGGDATDQLGDVDRVESPDRDVVQERERLGASTHDVVGAHRDEVDADRVEPPDSAGDRGLRADAIGRRDEQRLTVAGRIENAPPKPPSPSTLSGRRVESTWARMRSTARSPASTSTPALRYADLSATATEHRRLLEDELAARGVIRDRLRVVAVEAGEAEPVVWQVQGRQHAPDRQVAERVGPDEVADLVDVWVAAISSVSTDVSMP